MAVIPKNEMILGGRTQIPESVYGVKILAAQVKTGQKEGARPCLHIDAEIIAPLAVEVGGDVIKVAGRRFNFMPCLIDSSVEYGLAVIYRGLQASDFPFEKFGADGDIDTDKFSVLIGHKMQMHLSSFEDVKRRAATEEELRANPAQRFVPLTDLKGQKISGGWRICSPKRDKNGEAKSPSWEEVVGPYDGDDNGGF